jgi:mRNA-degrading endonuclease toxin of MazEF toxin-antitoxin module
VRARKPRRGEIWLVHTPGQPEDPHQPRPALVVSENVRNRLADDVIVVPIFSAGRLGPTRVPLAAGTGGIRHDSILFCEEITTIADDFLEDGPLGPPVPRALLQQVLRAVRRALGEVLPEP